MKYGQFAARKNAYQEAMADNYLECAEEFYEKTVAKLERKGSLNFTVDSYYHGDFRAHLDNGDGVIFLYAPTYKGGYENILVLYGNE